MTEDVVSLKGRVKLVHFRKGKLIEEIETPNVIVAAGMAQVAGLINGVVTDYFDYIAIGTGTTSASTADTSLEAETHRGSATTSRVTTTHSNDTAQLVHTFDFTDSYAITESGVFDASSGGNMLCRQTFSAINVASGDSLQVTWKIQVS